MAQPITPCDALVARNLTLAYDGREVAHDLSVTIPEGKITVIIGPNACGKSTLLRALSRLLRPVHGTVHLHDRNVTEYSPKHFARELALLPQSSVAPFGITVADLVARGRFPHQRMLQQYSHEDERIVTEALRATGVSELSDRSVQELSGGQRQRVWIAMLLAQNAPIMLLDEPTTFLDVPHQLEVLELCRRLNHEDGRTLVLVLHDLNQAARFADHLIVLRNGTVARTGSPVEVMTEEMLSEVFQLTARVMPDPVFGTPMVIPIASQHRTEAS